MTNPKTLHAVPPHRITAAAGLTVTAWADGTLHRIAWGDLFINLFAGCPLDGGPLRVLLRRRDGGGVVAARDLVGPRSPSRFAAGDDGFAWRGAALGVAYVVTLRLHPGRPAWRWRVALQWTDEAEPAAADTFDVVLLQDLGLAAAGQVLNNEAFTSQYLDHTPLRHPTLGHVLATRQNLDQAGKTPWLLHACAPGCAAFATDALQVFTPTAKLTGEPEAALRADLPSARLQHESALAGLQSVAVKVTREHPAVIDFLAVLREDHPEPSGPDDLGILDLEREELVALPDVTVREVQAPRGSILPRPLPSPLRPETLPEDELARLFGRRDSWRHVEEIDGRLASFFTADGRHVVTLDKELAFERRTGVVLRAGRSLVMEPDTLSTTVYAPGVFASQLTAGNTSFHKLTSVARDGLNVVRSSGVRVIVHTADGPALLAVPSAFEMGLWHACWHYRHGDATLTVTTRLGDDNTLSLTLATTGRPLRWTVLTHLVAGVHEHEHPVHAAIDAAAATATIVPDPASLPGTRCPGLRFTVAGRVLDVESLATLEDLPWLVLRTRAVRETAVVIEAGGVQGSGLRVQGEEAEPEQARGDNPLLHHTLTPDPRPLNPRIAASLPWFIHQAWCHLTVPRGLEQFTAAAWGTRDVCQGPVEMLLGIGKPDAVKPILRELFAQQFHPDAAVGGALAGGWSQWFMHDPYGFIRDAHAHGDVVVWPLKALCDYLEATAGFALLDEPVPYRGADATPTPQRDTIARHVEHLLAYIRARFVPGTSLIRYGEGDWNDALQPADPTLRDRMVSSWTVALLFQQVMRYAALLRKMGRDASDLDTLAGRMSDDFHRHCVRSGVVAGYVLFDGDRPRVLLHPEDDRTGIRFSLIPMTRSIMAGLFDGELTRRHLALIREHLWHPDGVRLMDRPPTYRGGPQVLFRRAESASFFGREIGLMYTHAHLRWAQTLGVLGDVKGCEEALLAVTPVASAQLPGAAPRQHNAYFSSSDAAFPDRWAAQQRYDNLRAGRVRTHAGWRVYSSGPGIYVGLVMKHLATGGEAGPQA